MNQTTDVERVAAAVTATINKHWVLFLVEGILLTVLGMLAILLPAVASLAATLIFGWILLLSGAMGLVTSMRARHARVLAGRCCQRSSDSLRAYCSSPGRCREPCH